MIIRAYGDIKKGDEIYLSYINPLLNYSERKKQLNCWKFTCHCKLCELDAKGQKTPERNRMLRKLCQFYNH